MHHLLNVQPLALQMPGFEEWIVIAIIGVLLFGKRLPEMGRSLGKGIVEFKKGLKGIEDDVETSSSQPARPMMTQQPNYKFDPNTGQPLQPQLNSAVPPGAKFDPYTGKPLNAETVSNESHASSV